MPLYLGPAGARGPTLPEDRTSAYRADLGRRLLPAPRMPPGHVLLGYDERGHCPMLVDNRCSIYGHRPRTCRTYDCRIFPAAGVDADNPLVADQAVRWRFRFPTETDRIDHQAVQAAAASLRTAGAAGPAGGAVRAVMETDPQVV